MTIKATRRYRVEKTNEGEAKGWVIYDFTAGRRVVRDGVMVHHTRDQARDVARKLEETDGIWAVTPPIVDQNTARVG